MYIIIRTVINMKYFILLHILIHSNSSYLPNKQSSCLFKIFRKDHLLPPVILRPRPAFQGGNLRSTNIFFYMRGISLYITQLMPQSVPNISYTFHFSLTWSVTPVVWSASGLYILTLFLGGGIRFLSTNNFPPIFIFFPYTIPKQ